MNRTETVVFTLAGVFFAFCALVCAARAVDDAVPSVGPVIGFWGALLCLGGIFALSYLADIRGELRQANLRRAVDRGEGVEIQPLLPTPVLSAPQAQPPRRPLQ